jgi:hypothetical protein
MRLAGTAPQLAGTSSCRTWQGVIPMPQPPSKQSLILRHDSHPTQVLIAPILRELLDLWYTENTTSRRRECYPHNGF